MEKLGFNSKWRELMMLCISFVYSSILINRRPRGDICPSRGLRQGELLSPYLFLICVEGLSALIKKTVHDGFMDGVTIC